MGMRVVLNCFVKVVESLRHLLVLLPHLILHVFLMILSQAGFRPSKTGTPKLRMAAIEAGMRVADVPVTWNARVEFPLWYREQAVTETLHRYGNIIAKPETLKRK